MRPIRSVLAMVVAMLWLAAGCAQTDTDGTEASPSVSSTGDAALTITDAWVRATTDTTDPTMTAGFGIITNHTDAAVKLVSATSPSAPMVQLHEMVTEDGEMVMQEAPDGIEIPAGESVSLAPGGFHLMLMNLSGELAVGDEVSFTLTFDDGTNLTTTALVKQYAEEEDHYHSTTSAAPVTTATAAPTATLEIRLADGKADPNGERVELSKGDILEVKITSDRDDEVHIHGYDIGIEVKAGQSVSQSIILDQTGRFEVETHEPVLVVAQLIVR